MDSSESKEDVVKTSPDIFALLKQGEYQTVEDLIVNKGYNPTAVDENEESLLDIAVNTDKSRCSLEVKKSIVSFLVEQACAKCARSSNRYPLSKLRKYLTYALVECFSNNEFQDAKDIANIILDNSKVEIEWGLQAVFNLDNTDILYKKLNNFTLTMLAVYCGNPKFLRYLLEKGANPNIANSIGQNALTIALRSSSRDGKVIKPEIVNLLFKYKALPKIYYIKQVKDQNGRLLNKLEEIDFKNPINLTMILRQIKPKSEYVLIKCRQIAIMALITNNADLLDKTLKYIDGNVAVNITHEERFKFFEDLIKFCGDRPVCGVNISSLLRERILCQSAIFAVKNKSGSENILTYALYETSFDLIELCARYYDKYFHSIVIHASNIEMEYKSPSNRMVAAKDALILPEPFIWEQKSFNIVDPVSGLLKSFLVNELDIMAGKVKSKHTDIEEWRIDIGNLIETYVGLLVNKNPSYYDSLVMSLKQTLYKACEIAAYNGVASYLKLASNNGFLEILHQQHIANLLQLVVMDFDKKSQQGLLFKTQQKVINIIIGGSRPEVLGDNDYSALCYLLEAKNYQVVEMVVRAYGQYKIEFNAIELELVNKHLVTMANEKFAVDNKKIDVKLVDGNITVLFSSTLASESEAKSGFEENNSSNSITLLDLFERFSGLFAEQVQETVDHETKAGGVGVEAGRANGEKTWAQNVARQNVTITASVVDGVGGVAPGSVSSNFAASNEPAKKSFNQR